ncbi:Hypothetical protein NCS54_00740800 [Fusarium falciforme]|uniref:Hypothetical protein n=1 Tax=Fusarium falciforme TaxID=195108 RepID=UPI0023017CBC|nr:Hypothetical protein NCS54_00740800 [Fusarium falciforme]WAO90002.1 Hypothetical protein NCS54_00740800 [Fusarium falciforme]
MHLFSIYYIVPVTIAACASLLLVPAALSMMADRKSITYTFELMDDYKQSNDTVTNIVKEDTGAEHWKSTRTMIPTCYPPPMTLQAIEKLKEIKGVVVEDLPEEL